MRCPLVGRLGRVSLPPWARRPGACRAVASAELARSVTLICRTDLGLSTANKGDAMGPSAVRSQMPASEPGLGAARTANRPCPPPATDIRAPPSECRMPGRPAAAGQPRHRPGRGAGAGGRRIRPRRDRRALCPAPAGRAAAGPRPAVRLGMAPRAKLALDRARRTAKAGHRPRFDSADLLLGLLEIDDGMAVRLLRDLGVNPADIRARLRARAA